MMDLVVAMAPFLDEVTMTKTFDLIRPYLQVSVYSVFNEPYCGLKVYLVNCLFMRSD